MTKPRPLRWLDVGDHGTVMPDCNRCFDWLCQPGMAEAIASVGIERGSNVGLRAVEQYHDNRHQEV